MQFSYTARDLSGQPRVGTVAAASLAEAAAHLRQEGLFVVSLAEEKAQAVASAATAAWRKRVSRAEVINVTAQLAVMVEAGVPLAQAIRGAATQAAGPALRELLDRLAGQVEAGDAFSAALARCPRHFDKTYVNLIRAAEASGTLGPMLDRLALRMQAEQETRQKVVGAMIYPAAMLLMCVGTSVFLLTYVFPKLTPMFAARKLDLPTPTKLLMALSAAMTGHWYLFLAGAAAAVGFFLYARTRPWGRQALDRAWLHVPILGPMLRKVILARCLRTLATTVNAGVPMLESLRLAANVSNNVWYERAWLDVAEQVTGGRQIHQALDGHPLFPPTLLQMVASGEGTGRLGQVLTRVSDAFDREVANAIKSATSMIEPIMVFVMGGVIGTIALAMLLPIFQLSGNVG
ncbi:MAG TPA: type II secretion system F family protein [Planctomycetaceae bacterium]